jgi:hypothetical protein
MMGAGGNTTEDTATYGNMTEDTLADGNVDKVSAEIKGAF